MSATDGLEPGADWAIVAEVAQRYEAELLAGRLLAAGIEARVVDQSFRQEPLPGVRSFAIVRVYVPGDRLGEARGVLDEAPPPIDETEP